MRTARTAKVVCKPPLPIGDKEYVCFDEARERLQKATYREMEYWIRRGMPYKLLDGERWFCVEDCNKWHRGE